MNRVKAASNGTAQTVQTSDFVPTKPVKLALVKFRSQVLALPHSAPERASHISQILAAFATKCLPQLIPDVDPAALRDFLAAHAGDRLGLQHRPWKAASKALRQALGLLGIERMPRRREHEPSEAWSALISHVKNATGRSDLRTFGIWATLHDVAPPQVRQFHFLQFLEDAKETTREDDTRALFTDFCRAWDSARTVVAGWPDVAAECKTKYDWYSDDLSQYSGSIRGDVEAVIAHWRLPGKSSRRWGGASDCYANDIRETLRRFLHGLVEESGLGRASFASLKVALADENVRMGLNWHLKRNGGKVSKSVYNMACLIRRIKLECYKVPKAQLQAFDDLVDDLNPRSTAVAVGVREFFMVAKSTGLLLALDGLGRRIIERYKGRHFVKVSEAVEIQCALAVELYLCTAETRYALVATRIGRVMADGAGYLVDGCYVSPLGQIKEHIALSETAIQLLELYLRVARPRLARRVSDCLFPGMERDFKHPDVLGRQVTEFCGRELKEFKIRLTPEMLRYAVGAILLRNDPKNIEVVRRSVGHRSKLATERAFRIVIGLATTSCLDAELAAARKQRSKVAVGDHHA